MEPPPISKPCRKALSCQIVEYPSFFCVIVERWARGLSPVSVIPPMGLAPLSQYHGMVWYGMVWYGMVWYGIPWYGMVWLSQYQSQNLLLGLQSYLGHLCLDARCNYLLHHFRPLMMMVIRMSRSLLFLEAACNFSCERVNWCNWQFRFNFSNSFREGAKLFTIWCLWLSYYLPATFSWLCNRLSDFPTARLQLVYNFPMTCLELTRLDSATCLRLA